MKLTKIQEWVNDRIADAEERLEGFQIKIVAIGLVVAVLLSFWVWSGSRRFSSHLTEATRGARNEEARWDYIQDVFRRQQGQIEALERHGRATNIDSVGHIVLVRRDSGYVFVNGRERAKKDGTFAHTEAEYMALLKELDQPEPCTHIYRGDYTYRVACRYMNCCK